MSNLRLIISVSWEERFLFGLSHNLDTREIAEVIFLSPKENKELSSDFLSDAYRMLKGKSIPFKTFDISYYNNLEIWNNLDILINGLSDAEVLIDISTMPRHIILTCMHYLECQGKKFESCYFPPDSYGDWLSRDSSKPQLLYRHSGIMYPDLPTCLFVLTGFEYERISSLIGFMDPKKVIIINQTGEQFDNELKMEVINNHVQKKHKVDFEFYSVDFYSDPYQQALFFNNIILENMHQYNILATTFAPKNSTLALYILNKINNNVGLSYALCREYNPLYSKGINLKGLCSHQIDLGV